MEELRKEALRVLGGESSVREELAKAVARRLRELFVNSPIRSTEVYDFEEDYGLAHGTVKALLEVCPDMMSADLLEQLGGPLELPVLREMPDVELDEQALCTWGERADERGFFSCGPPVWGDNEQARLALYIKLLAIEGLEDGVSEERDA